MPVHISPHWTQTNLDERGQLAALRVPLRCASVGIRPRPVYPSLNVTIRWVFDELWLDYNQIIAVRPTSFYLPLAAAVVKWHGIARFQKSGW